ncbi:MAG TPA: sigma-70 family RNA polymerase sigma factor [Solirubrobacteraceae bacterium]|nr:sigma-70 family RNA polymerase sigma factor [Solirubrobacteraceae bacterium]
MSPLPLRRYRAERLLSAQFDALRASVIARVRKRLAAEGAAADALDLDACYAAAWQGLYGALLEGREVLNPTGWLIVVTLRRAIDELRADAHLAGPSPHDPRGTDRVWEGHEDLAGELDDRARLAQVMEGIRRLDPREREAAALCYLHGLTRAEAAARMGISDRAMRRLMEGGRTGREGVAAKVGRVLDAIREGRWCEEQRSLMAALALGVLDPAGERYRLANAHRQRCPACRAYVVSLRGLAALLPPPLLPLLRDLPFGHGLGAAAAGTGKGACAGSAAPGAASVGAGASSGAGTGAGVGGGWVLGGAPFGAKLAVGCALVLGLGVGCSELIRGGPSRGDVQPRARESVRQAAPRGAVAAAERPRSALAGGVPSARHGGAVVRGHGRGAAPGAGAPSEFGPERSAWARAGIAPVPAPTQTGSASAPEPVAASAAAREFGP